MGERKGQNKYYPPDFDYKIHKSLSGYHGQHALRERARKLDQGILIIRFEMPYNIWCDGCNNHVGMGVRYNAEKSKVGSYYTTPIFKFRMKCHLCPNHFEIKTDPANHDYVIISGARRKEQRWNPHENEQIVPEDRDNQKRLALDSMYKLEHTSIDQSKGKSAVSSITQILDHKAGHKDDFSLNQLARKMFRDSKKAMKTKQEEDDTLKKKLSLNINLVEEIDEDVKIAKLMKLSSHKRLNEELETVEDKPLFEANSIKLTIQSPMTLSKDATLKTLKRIISSDSKEKRSKAFNILFRNSLDSTHSLSKSLSSDLIKIKCKNNKSENESLKGEVIEPSSSQSTSLLAPVTCASSETLPDEINFAAGNKFIKSQNKKCGSNDNNKTGLDTLMGNYDSSTSSENDIEYDCI